ncbi:MAG TPA: hypothetical protein VF507_09565 [Pyrinomonadaceae bacterium]|jgi:hypothetical protein
MRWKLLLIVSLLATLLGAGATLLLLFFLLPDRNLGAPDAFVLGTLIAPLAAVAFASVFVYRHTARRRPLQAVLTAVFSLLLTLTALLACSMFLQVGAPNYWAPAPLRRGVG